MCSEADKGVVVVVSARTGGKDIIEVWSWEAWVHGSRKLLLVSWVYCCLWCLERGLVRSAHGLHVVDAATWTRPMRSEVRTCPISFFSCFFFAVWILLSFSLV